MRLIPLALGLMMSHAAWADDAALLIGNERYGVLDRLVGGAGVGTMEISFASHGFKIFQAANASGIDAVDLANDFAREAPDASRLIVALVGRFATDGERTWLLPVDADQPELFGMSGALSVESIMTTLAYTQGQAVLVLGVDTGEDARFGPLLYEGVGMLAIPQGVTVVRANPMAAATFMSDVAMPDADLMQLIQSNRRLAGDGFMPERLQLVDQTAVVTVIDDAGEPADPSPVDDGAETALWDGAQALDTQAAYENYLSRYPNGAYAEDANAMIVEITTEPQRPARLAEDALALGRDTRRTIQKNLTILDFDPRGIDGIFGPGTRNALVNWQQQNGFSQSSYLTLEQISRLDAQASRRQAEIDAAAERARATQERLDRAYWDETGASGEAPGLQAYLARYPDGIFADQAQAALDQIAAAIQAAADAQDRAAWDTAIATNTAAAFETYVQAFPNGASIDQARAKIADFATPASGDDAALLAVETALGLNAITMRLIEARLGQLGLDPGPVDGEFDAQTRRSVRNFQRDRALPGGGYLNEETVVRLLADGLQSLGE